MAQKVSQSSETTKIRAVANCNDLHLIGGKLYIGLHQADMITEGLILDKIQSSDVVYIDEKIASYFLDKWPYIFDGKEVEFR